MRRTPALIVGGGPAGAAAAIWLARAGTRPLLVERRRAPADVVCGGFLGGDAIRLLDRLGIAVADLGATPIGWARLVAGRRVAEAALPFAAAGLSRRALDTALLDRARSEGAAVEPGVLVRGIDRETRTLHLADGGALAADALFLANGKHELRGVGRDVRPDADPPVGLRVRLSPSPSLTRALSGTIELHLLHRGYAGLLLQEDGGANLCLSIAQSRLRQAGGRPERLIAELAEEAPLLAERCSAASRPGDWSTIARVPYGWCGGGSEAGLFRLGDQAAVIASLAGDGIAIALDSGTRGATAFLRLGSEAAASFQTGFARRARGPLALAGLFRHGGETPWLAGPLVSLLARAPCLLGHMAALTRIGDWQE